MEQTNEIYHDKGTNALIYLPKEEVEKYIEIDKNIRSEDLIYGKHNFNRYWTMIAKFCF